MRTVNNILLGIGIITGLIVLDKMQIISILAWLRGLIQFLGGDPNVVLKKDVVFSSEVYGGIIQGMIAAAAVWVAYWTYQRQQKQVLRDRLYEKRLEIYPVLYRHIKCLMREFYKHKDNPRELFCEEFRSKVNQFWDDVDFNYGLLLSGDIFSMVYDLKDSFDLFFKVLNSEDEELIKVCWEEVRGNLHRLIHSMKDEIGIYNLTSDLRRTVESDRGYAWWLERDFKEVVRNDKELPKWEKMIYILISTLLPSKLRKGFNSAVIHELKYKRLNEIVASLEEEKKQPPRTWS